jgi:hypothetical protein
MLRAAMRKKTSDTGERQTPLLSQNGYGTIFLVMKKAICQNFNFLIERLQ